MPMAVIQILKHWKSKVLRRSELPAGHVVVCVGSKCRKFIVPVTHLNHPAFARLLEESEKDYGFDCSCSSHGPLRIPCDESEFEEALRVVIRSANLASRCRVETESMHLLDSVLLLVQYP